MNEREERVNQLRKARGLKPSFAETVTEPTENIEEEPFKEDLEIEETSTEKKKKSTKKKDIITETKEEMNTDTLFETDSATPKEEEKVEEEQLNE